jgi:WD40 repeat protein
LLVSLSDDFSLSIYDLSSGEIQESQTLSSFTSYPPASLVLSSPSPAVFKLVIAYATPVYPKHWSVGATELIISSSSDMPTTSSGSTLFSPSFREDYKYPTTTKMSVIANRTIRAFDVPMGWVNESFLRTMREQWGRKLTNVADAQTDGKWVVLAPGDDIHHEDGPMTASPSHFTTSSSISSPLHSPTSLQLYRLILPTQGNSISASPPKLNFVRNLHGQTSPVSCLALADGRCVSLGLNGSIWVWDLEGGTGAEVAPADDLMMDETGHPTKGTVSFDERRIVTARGGKVVVRRFDI